MIDDRAALGANAHRLIPPWRLGRRLCLSSTARALACAIVVTVSLFEVGCSNARGRSWFAAMRPKSSKDWLDMALDSEHPDDRRRGVIGLAASSDATAPWAVKVYDTIARTDADAMVRRAALHALLKVPNPDRVPTALKLLNSIDRRYEDARKASAPVRWEAAKLLFAVVQRYAYGENQHAEIVDTVLALLPGEKEPNVRLTLIETLAYFPERPVLAALIAALDNEDFAVQHAAEMSLVALTGVTHHHDPDAWRQWLAQADDPFAHTGETPRELQAKRGKPRWDWLQW